jgi:hypothetical protein
MVTGKLLALYEEGKINKQKKIRILLRVYSSNLTNSRRLLNLSATLPKQIIFPLPVLTCDLRPIQYSVITVW